MPFLSEGQATEKWEFPIKITFLFPPIRTTILPKKTYNENESILHTLQVTITILLQVT
jgi:hypothetical protein